MLILEYREHVYFSVIFVREKYYFLGCLQTNSWENADNFFNCARTHTHTHTHLQEGESQPSSFAQRHLHLAVTLYYKLLDAIMRDEERKNPDFGSLQVCALLLLRGTGT